MKLAERAANAQAAAVARLLTGGVLTMESAEGKPLVRAPFAGFEPPSAGKLTARSFFGIGSATGKPVRFIALAADDTEVLRGSVGPRDADLIFLPPLVVEHGEVMLDFVYRVSGRRSPVDSDALAS